MRDMGGGTANVPKSVRHERVSPHRFHTPRMDILRTGTDAEQGYPSLSHKQDHEALLFTEIYTKINGLRLRTRIAKYAEASGRRSKGHNKMLLSAEMWFFWSSQEAAVPAEGFFRAQIRMSVVHESWPFVQLILSTWQCARS
jgi:hypothetical protein